MASSKHPLLSTLLSTLNHQRTTEIATYLIFESIVIIRISLGYFPTRAKWFAFFGLLGLSRLWLKQAGNSPTNP